MNRKFEFSELVSRLVMEEYQYRLQLLVDLGSHLLSCGSSLWSSNRYKIQSWGEIKCQGEASLVQPSASQGISRADFLSWGYNKLIAGEAADVEEIAFSTLFNIFTNKELGKPVTLSTNIKSPPHNGAACIRLTEHCPSNPLFDDNAIEHCCHADSHVQMLLRLSMLASKLFFWVSHDHEVINVADLRNNDRVLICSYYGN